jgi:heme/copper-type cytochrome/quinol oxidase subunit 2
MSRVFVVDRNMLRLVGLVVLLAVAGWSAWAWWNKPEAAAVMGTPDNPRVIQMVTTEYSTKLPDGSELEVYRWNPGTIFVKEGETVELRILGVNGDRHPFRIEGLDVRGEVVKGKETVVTFTADKEGIYRIICPTHSDLDRGGPMIAYLVVD